MTAFRVLCREPNDDHPSSAGDVIDVADERYEAVEGWKDLMVASEVIVNRSFDAGSISLSCYVVEAIRSVVSEVWPRDSNRDVVFLAQYEDDEIVIAGYVSDAYVCLDGYGYLITFKGKDPRDLAKLSLTEPFVKPTEFVSAARALIGHRVKIEVEDPRRLGMSLGYVGQVMDVVEDALFLGLERSEHRLSDVSRIEVRNDDFKTRSVRDMELVSDAMKRSINDREDDR